MLKSLIVFVFITFTFAFPLTSTINTAVANNDNTLAIQNNDYSNLKPEAREFESKEELFKSGFWKDLLKKKNPKLAASTVIIVKDTNSAYHFANTELLDEHEGKSANGISLLPFNTPKKREIKLIEVRYGRKETCEIHDVPISFCISSRLSSGGATYTQSYKWSQGLAVAVGPLIDASVTQLGASLSAGTEDLTLSFANTGSIKCIADPGKRVQVFASFKYAFFPKAKKRDALFVKGFHDFKTGAWSKITSNHPDFKNFGAVFFDLSTTPDYYCVDKEEKLICDKNKIIDKSTDNPIEGLKYATFT